MPDATSPAFEDATTRLHKLAGVGAPFSARSGVEARYGEAYQALVRAGTHAQLALKYRRTPTGKRMAGGHNNGGSSLGKHMPHPDVHGFRVHGYKCEPRWNPAEKM